MNEILLVLIFLSDIIFLQPIKIILSVIFRFMWNPSVDGSDIINCIIRPGNEFDIHEFHDDVIAYDLKSLTEDGDGFKWLTILLGCVQNRLGYLQKRNEILQTIDNYFWNNGTIGRYPIGHPSRYNCVNFSGDMTAGLLFWLSQESKTDIPFSEVPENLLSKLVKVFEIVTFSRESGHGNKKQLLAFANAREENETYDSNSEDRGQLHRVYGMAPDIVRLLAWFKLGYMITGQRRFQFFYYLLRVGFAPLLFVSRGDYGIFFKKLMVVAWYTSHSNMYCLTALYTLTKDRRFFKMAKGLQKDFWWNPDITGVFAKYFFDSNEDRNLGDLSRYLPLIDRAKWKGTEKIPLEPNVQTYFDIRNLEKVTLSSKWLLPEYTGHKYLYENNPLKFTTCKQERRDTFPVDRFIAAFHLTDL